MSSSMLKMSKTMRGAAITEDAFAAMDASFAPARAAKMIPIRLAILAAIFAVDFAAPTAAFAPNLPATLPPTFATPNLTPIFVASRACSFATTLTPVFPIFIALNARFIAFAALGSNPSPARNLRMAGESAMMRLHASPLAMSSPISRAISPALGKSEAGSVQHPSSPSSNPGAHTPSTGLRAHTLGVSSSMSARSSSVSSCLSLSGVYHRHGSTHSSFVRWVMHVACSSVNSPVNSPMTLREMHSPVYVVDSDSWRMSAT